MRSSIVLTIFWILLFILSFIFVSFFKEEIITISTHPKTLRANDFIGQFDTQTDHKLGRSGWITGMELEVENAPGSTLHHIVITNLYRYDSTCPDKFPERLHATAKELTPLNFPPGYGYLIDAREKIATYTHLYNPTDQTFENVVVKIKIHMQPYTFFRRLKNVHPIWLDIKNCTWDATEFVPPKTSQVLTQPSPTKIIFNSELVYAFGHLHNYGRNLQITLDGKELLNFVPEPSPQNIEKIKYYSDISDQRIRLNYGQELNLFANYDNTTQNQIDAMGLGILYYYRY